MPVHRELPSQEYLNNVFQDIGYTLRRVPNGNPVQTLSDRGYYVVTLNRRRCLVHRILYKMRTGLEPPEVDHINGIRTDNNPENLRASDRCSNALNMSMHKDNASGVKGVSWNECRQRYRVRVMLNGVTHLGGYFKDIKIATNKAIEMRNKLHGEFANHRGVS